MDIFFLRHGEAEPIYSDDSALTPKGIDSIKKTARAMEILGIRPEEILSSHLSRALETATIIREQLKIEIPVHTCDQLTPPGDCDNLFRLLKASHKSPVLLVGHEPLISRTISRLISGDEQSFITIKKGSLAKVFIAEYTRHIRGSLEFLLPPNVLLDILAGSKPID